MHGFFRICLLFFTAFILLVASFLCMSPQVFADGGAPNVAYVAGTMEGITTIDIGKQKVTSTIPLPGDPHTTLLSIDGRVLYATQPNLGDIVVIAAKTKQILCKASVPGHPTLLTLDPGTNILYTVSNDAAIVSALDPNTCAIKYTLKMGSPIYGLAVAVVGLGFAGGDDNQLWVATSSISLTPQQASALDIIDTIAHYGAAILIALVAILLIGRNKLRSLRSNHKPR